MTCICGKKIEPKMVEVFGNFSVCSDCASTNVVVRKAAAAIQTIIWEVYALKGEDAMVIMARELNPTLTQFNLKGGK